ncbi:MAG: hypothetical protein AAFU68_14550 [Pseudomonadota bacterium]
MTIKSLKTAMIAFIMATAIASPAAACYEVRLVNYSHTPLKVLWRGFGCGRIHFGIPNVCGWDDDFESLELSSYGYKWGILAPIIAILTPNEEVIAEYIYVANEGFQFSEEGHRVAQTNPAGCGGVYTLYYHRDDYCGDVPNGC